MDLSEKEAKIKTVATWGIGLGAMALLAPVVFLALQGVAALVAFVVIGAVAVNLAPAFGRLVAAWRIKAIQAVAAANPIETQKLFIMQSFEKHAKEQQALEEYRTEIANYEVDVTNYARQYGEQEAAEMQDYLRMQQDALQQMEDASTRAYAQLKTLEQEVKKWEAKYKMAEKGRKLSKRMGQTLTLSQDDKIAMEASFQKMQSSINASMVAMRARAQQAQKPAEVFVAPQAVLPKTATQGFMRTPSTPAQRLTRSNTDPGFNHPGMGMPTGSPEWAAWVDATPTNTKPTEGSHHGSSSFHRHDSSHDSGITRSSSDHHASSSGSWSSHDHGSSDSGSTSSSYD